MVWAAGFLVLDPPTAEAFRRHPGSPPRPRVYLEYGTHDELFDFRQVALPMRENLEKAGLDIEELRDRGMLVSDASVAGNTDRL